MVGINDNEFGLLRSYLSSICGIEVPPEKRYLFETRLRSFLCRKEPRSFSQLYASLMRDENKLLQREFLEAMTTHESSFFRDAHPFDLFQQELLPRIAKRRVAEARYLPARIRVLSAGCSAGQEPYSIAMCIHEWLETQDDLGLSDVFLVGADVSPRALAKAGEGVYDDNEVGKFIPHRFRSKHLTRHGNQWRVSDDVRAMVNFTEINLAEPFAYIGRFDIIFCRNVIIYFSIDLKQRTLSQFRQTLNPGGALLLGASESVYTLSDEFTIVHDGQTTYYTPA